MPAFIKYSVILMCVFHNQLFAFTCKPFECSFRRSDDSLKKIGQMTININQKSVSIPVKLITDSSRSMPIEIFLAPQNGKLYESLLVCDVKPVEFQTALLLLGYQPMNNKMPDSVNYPLITPVMTQKSDSFEIFLEWEENNRSMTQRIEHFVQTSTDSIINEKYKWFFNGMFADHKGNYFVTQYTSLISTVNEEDFAPFYVIILLKMNFSYNKVFKSNENCKILKTAKNLNLVIKPCKN